MLMFQLDIVYYIWRVLTNSSNRGSVRVILPYSEVSITPFLLSRSLYTENNPEFISSFSLISFTFSSPLTDISNNIFYQALTAPTRFYCTHTHQGTDHIPVKYLLSCDHPCFPVKISQYLECKGYPFVRAAICLPLFDPVQKYPYSVS